MKRFILLFLAVFLLMFLFSSCNKQERKDENEEENDTVDTTEEYYLNTLPKDLYSYDEIVIGAIDTNCVPEVISAEATVIDRTLFERDSVLEEYFDIVVSYHQLSIADEGFTEMMNLAQVQDSTVDILIHEADNLMNFAVNGFCKNLNEVDTVNLENEWWCQCMNQQLNFQGSLYISAGPVSQWYFGMPIAMAYNKSMAESFSISDIYSMVEAGEWTLEALQKLCTDYGVYSEEEMRYPISYAVNVAQYALYVSAGGQFATVDDENGIIVNLGNETSINIVTKLLKAFDPDTSYGSSVPASANVFTSSKALFWRATIGYFETYLPSSEIDYGIIPCPKYDAEQKEYVSCGWASSSFCVAIPNYLAIEQTEWSGLILEAYCFLGQDMLKPVKYDSIVKYQVASDPTCTKMLDIIFENVYFDINQIANFGGSIDVINDVLTGNISLGRLSSSFKAIESMIESDITKYNGLTVKK